MQRSSIIATVVAAGGILIAGSVASVAVINAASSSQPDSETIQLVAAGSNAAPSPDATVSPSAEQPTADAVELPTMEASKLPELPEVTQPADAPAAVQAAPAAAGTSTRKPSASTKADDDSQPTRSAEPATVSEAQARSIVLAKGDGVSVVSASKESHQGYRTWAVRVTRSNGEVLTGYVDRASGVVVDWTVNQKAPASQPTSSASGDDDDSESDDSDDDDVDEYEDDESDDDHDDDDD